MPGKRRCIFGCPVIGPVYTLPKDGPIRQQWIDFIFDHKPPSRKRCLVCPLHFTDDCFLNKSLYQCGLITKLTLKTNAIPTWKSFPANPAPIPPVAKPFIEYPTYPVASRSVATQLSFGTLRFQHYRSRGVQATERYVKGKKKPSKRPRLDWEVDEGDDFNNSSSTLQPGDSATDWSDRINSKSPDFEGAKYIVYESCLRELFDDCPVCKKHCVVDQIVCGTLVSYSQKCPHCSYTRSWQSQPMKSGVPQGNLELSAAVYFNGESYESIEKVCNTMNLKVHQSDTFKRHARDLLEPAIFHKWKADQAKLLEKAKMKETVAVSGDMTADSTGHTANSGCYVMMDFEDEKILDLQLVQRDEVDSSTNLETEGLKSCLHFLESKSVKVDSVVTQPHPEVEEYLEERDTPLYFDVWRVAEGLSKRLGSVAKQKDCEVLQRWLPGIKNHLYWTASSSQSGAEKVAKWTSLVNHIQDVHTHDDPLYPKCAHPIKVSRDPNKWFKPGSVALNKVKKILLNKRLLHTVSKLSSDHQSSALDSFHNLIPYFASKKRLFPFNGMLCRHYLAAMHHNENAKRERALSKEKLLWKLLLSKSEKCQARVLKQEASFGYRNDLMLLVLNEVQGDPVKFQKAMLKVPVPPPPRANGPSQEHTVDNKVSGVNTAVPSTGTSYVVTKVSWGNTAVPAVGRLYTDKLSEVSATMPAADRPYVDDMVSEFDTPVPAVGRPYLVHKVSEVNTAGPAVGRLYTNDKLSEFSATMPATDSPYEDDMVSEFDTAVPATDRPYLVQKVSEVNTAVAAVGRPYLFQKVSEAYAAVPGSEMDEPRQTSFLQDQSSTEES